MSTQLILYPQNYDGFNDISLPIFNQYIVNGINFTALSSTTLHNTTAVNPSEDAITNEPPLNVNTWYRYTTTGGSWGTVVAPSVSSGRLWLWFNGGTNGHTGVYQQMSSLSVGVSYDITIDLQVAAASGTVTLEIWTGTLLQSTNISSSNVTQITATFTANSPNDIFLIDYEGTATILYIDDISIRESSQTPTGVFTELQDGQVICDLYEEEDIPLSLSVDEFKNVAEKVQSYSKDFNLPATKRNNKIFDSIFEVTRADTGFNFNPYVKTKCVLKQDGYILFDGYLRLINIKDKEGEISYDVNLYSEVVALADTLKDKKFADLDFSELKHKYNKTQIKYSWNDTGTGITYLNPSTSGFRDAFSTVKYPFVDWTHQYPFDATTGYPILPNLESSFRPFINIKYLIERIFADTPFSFTSDFFNTTDFKKLYMDFNWGSDNTPAQTGITTFVGNWRQEWPIIGTTFSNYANTTFSALDIVPFNPLGVVVSEVPPNYNTTTNIITATVLHENYNINYSYTVENIDTVDRTIECQWLYNSIPIDYSAVQTIAAGSTFTYLGNFSQIMGVGDTLVAQFKSDDATGTKVRQYENGTQETASVTFAQNVLAITTNTILQTLRGELGQWDFLKGLMTMFNLVTMPDPDNPNNILIEPYSDVFITNTAGTNLASRSIQHDWTDKVDVSEMELTPLTDLNKKTVFKFVEDEDDYAFNVYKNSAGHLYGSKNYDASGFTILEGIDEIIAEPFAATIPKPLDPDPIFTAFITPSIYSMGDDSSTEGFENSPRIMYNNGIKDTGITYYIPDQNGVGDEDEDEFLQFSHLTDIPTVVSIPPVDTDTRDFHFGECQLITPIGDATVNNLYNIYWSPYYDELYNADTRIMTLKVNLSPADINTFKFNDKVFIKNRVFRVNKIDYKPNDLATVEFILIP
jgi:hypothetical protein